jgi:hypothetical protein
MATPPGARDRLRQTYLEPELGAGRATSGGTVASRASSAGRSACRAISGGRTAGLTIICRRGLSCGAIRCGGPLRIAQAHCLRGLILRTSCPSIHLYTSDHPTNTECFNSIPTGCRVKKSFCRFVGFGACGPARPVRQCSRSGDGTPAPGELAARLLSVFRSADLAPGGAAAGPSASVLPWGRPE